MLIPRNFRFSPDAPGGDPPVDPPAPPVDPPADPPVDPPPETPPGEKMVPQSEVDRIVKTRLAKDRRTRKAPKVETPNNGDSTNEPTNAEVIAELKTAKQELAWERAVKSTDFTERQSDMLRVNYLHDGTGTMEEYVEAHRDAFGTAAPVTPEAEVKPEPPKVSLPSGSPRKIDRANSTELVDLMSLTADELDRMTPAQARTVHETVLADHATRSGAPPIPSVLKKG